jgi:hypothetical protein
MPPQGPSLHHRRPRFLRLRHQQACDDRVRAHITQSTAWSSMRTREIDRSECRRRVKRVRHHDTRTTVQTAAFAAHAYESAHQQRTPTGMRGCVRTSEAELTNVTRRTQLRSNNLRSSSAQPLPCSAVSRRIDIHSWYSKRTTELHHAAIASRFRKRSHNCGARVHHLVPRRFHFLRSKLPTNTQHRLQCKQSASAS